MNFIKSRLKNNKNSGASTIIKKKLLVILKYVGLNFLISVATQERLSLPNYRSYVTLFIGKNTR